MRMRVLNSGSVGNCYLFEASNATLIVECGVNFKLIKEALNFDFSNVVGALVTHEHKDHSIAMKDVALAGIDIYTGQGTIDVTGLRSHRLKPIQNQKPFHVGPFKILPFDIKHSNSDGTPCAEPYGFLINHEECGNTLFLTDTFYSPYRFKNLHNVLIEANYSQELIDKRLYEGKMLGFLRDRVMRSHMSIETCSELLEANDIKAVNNIVLIHLSDSNSDAKRFRERIAKQTGKTVYIAEKGLSINLNKTPF